MAPSMVCRDRLALAFVVALLSGKPDASTARHHKSPAGGPPASPPSSLTSTSQVSMYDFSPDNCSSMMEFGFVSSHSTVVAEEMLPPSPAPSQAPTCDFATSNARGRYTSELNPCTFRFHAVDETMEEMDFIEYHTSDLCTDENTIGHRTSSSLSGSSSTRGAAAASMLVKEYVKDFPDECVGDFGRCYSLEHHSKIVWEFLCEKEWKLPEGTTHISVDCTADKKLVLETAIRERQQATHQRQQSMRTVYQLKFTNFAFIAGACLVGILAIAHLIVKPVSQMMVSSLSLTGPQDAPHDSGGGGGSTVATGDTSCCEVEHQCPCLTNRTSSVSVDETSSRISSSMDGSFHLMGGEDEQAAYVARMHNHHHHLNHLGSFHDIHSPPGTVSHSSIAQSLQGRDEMEHQGSHVGSEPAERSEVEDTGPQESVHAVPCNGENEMPRETSLQEQHQQQEVVQHGQASQVLEFERQVPADFDAIPIVAALPIQDDFGTMDGDHHDLPLRAQNVVACPEGL